MLKAYSDNIGLFCTSLGIDDFALGYGLFMLMSDMDRDGELDSLPDHIFYYNLGFMSRELSRKLSQIKRDRICDKYHDTKRDIKRDMDRDRQRDYRERKRKGPSFPPSPTPLSPLLSPQEKERENAPLSLRDRPPEGVTLARTKSEKRFRKPTLEEIKAYAQEIDYNLNAEAFYDYYEGNGWRTGKNPMKDWKAIVRNWKRRDEERGLNTHAKPSRPADEDLFAGLTEEQIAEYERLANDGHHYG